MQPQGPASLLVNPKKKKMLLDLKHGSRIMQLKVVEDPDDAQGSSALVGCANGSILLWDLEGVNRGEVYAELRSLTRWEAFLPIALLLVSWMQATSFAFGPEVHWMDEVRLPANYTRRVVLGEIDLFIDIPKYQIFLPLAFTVLTIMVLFLLVVLCALPDHLNHLIYLTQSTRRYRREQSASGLRPMHRLKRLLDLVRSGGRLFLGLCATIWVSPMFKVLAQAVDCVEEGDGKVLHTAPRIRCFEGIHKVIAILIFAITPLYFAFLLPFVGVEGNAQYMKWKKLFFPLSYWAQSAHRKATVQDLGPLHPNPDTIFKTLMIDLVAKVLLPIIETELTSRAILQQILICTVGLLVYVTSFLFPPKADRKFCCVVQGLRLFTLCAMLCGMATVLLKEGSMVPLAGLGLAFVAVPVHTFLRVRSIKMKPRVVQRCSTSTIPRRTSATTRDQGLEAGASQQTSRLRRMRASLTYLNISSM